MPEDDVEVTAGRASCPSRRRRRERRTLGADPRGWRERAACLGQDTELFFPDGTTGAWLDQAARAKAFCARCEVREQCLNASIDPLEHGIWGGLGTDLRRELRRKRLRGRRTAG